MKKYRIIVVSIIVISLILMGYFIWGTSEIRKFAGEYESVDATDSSYELTLSKTGKLTVVDVGAGNPAVEGYVFRVPFRDTYFLKTGGETDGAFLSLEENQGKADVWLSVIGQVEGENLEDFRIITIETRSGHMQFNESSYFEQAR